MLGNGSANLKEQEVKSRGSVAPGVNTSANKGNSGSDEGGKRGSGSRGQEGQPRDDDVGRPSIVCAIRKKRDKQELDREEIDWFVEGATKSLITEAQIGAMLMAICINGMTDGEATLLTLAMIRSGRRLSYPPSWTGSIVGKHSTGGVGDKVSLVLVPALAACGLKVPKMSGRGLGHTGGTIDKLESIRGYRAQLTTDEIVDVVDRVGCCIVGQTGELAPADKILYAIRDTTATTESLPLIASSVMSKKAAESLDALSLEVTYGKAALIKTRDEALRLAWLMNTIAEELGIRTTSVLTRMDNVFGRTVGNSLEVIEAIQILKGEEQASKDIIDVTCTLGGHLLWHLKREKTAEDGFHRIEASLKNGEAAAKFRQMLVAHGVAEEDADRLIPSTTSGNKSLAFSSAADSGVLPRAKHVTPLLSRRTGYVSSIDAFVCGCFTRNLGAGRQRPEETIDHSAGLRLLVDIGSFLKQGDVWAEVHHNRPLSDLELSDLESALDLSHQPVHSLPAVDVIL